MVNGNFLKAMYAQMSATTASRPPRNIIDINNNQYTMALATSYNGVFYATNTLFTALTTGYNGGLFVGTDGTEATENDINLYSRIDDSELDTISMTMAISTNGKIVFTRIFTYKGPTEKQIYEIGLFTTWTISTTTDYKPFMLAREVLDSPITVNNGDTFSVSMVID